MSSLGKSTNNFYSVEVLGYVRLFFAPSTDNAAIEELKKQINDIVQELNLLKEQQALQTGIFPAS